jgi:hypothetical protein
VKTPSRVSGRNATGAAPPFIRGRACRRKKPNENKEAEDEGRRATITITAETEADKRRLTHSLLSGDLLKALNAAGAEPVSMELRQKAPLPAKPE